MIRRMEPGEIMNGYLYAVSASRDQPFALEPYLAVATSHGIRFLHAAMFHVDTAHDGPHPIGEAMLSCASQFGWELHADDIWSRWSERTEAERVLASFAPALAEIEAEHPIVVEAERILMEGSTPQGQASTWLRNSDHWAGSSMNVLYDANGQLGGAFVTVYTANPFQLRSLLRWLGVPKELVVQITGLER